MPVRTTPNLGHASSFAKRIIEVLCESLTHEPKAVDEVRLSRTVRADEDGEVRQPHVARFDAPVLRQADAVDVESRNYGHETQRSSLCGARTRMSVASGTLCLVSVVAEVLTQMRLLEQSSALRLLRSDNLVVTLALLRAHLGDAGARVATDELHALIDIDLERLREHLDLPQTGKAYCDAWRQAGFIVRRPVVGARGETYELAAETHGVLRYVQQLAEPRSTLTESRLVALTSAVRNLAVETDPDISRRLAALEAERERLDDEIAQVRAGQIGVLDERRSLERVTDILLQAQDLPGDLASVRSRFEELNRDLRSSILDTEATQSAVLDDIFRGVDLIESSDQGRTFTAFSSLIRDPARSATLDADIAAVLTREFAHTLPPEVRRTLRSLVRDLKAGSRDVHGVLTEFARGLRRYVHSQEFQRDRVLGRLLAQALVAAGPAAAATKPYADAGVELELSSARFASLGELSLHDPSELDTGEPLTTVEAAPLDLEQLRALARETEIDFVELITAVDDVLARATTATVADVLAAHPATQGVASVVGLLSLAHAHGHVSDGDLEALDWHGTDGVARSAHVPVHTFTGRISR